ncbi:hypothetical protein COV19_05160 [Candidatus Woesearchaeota archaeon CG10_big_fil_rev_8_21_14_0_10_44_13]|nr:MAG: hypothetical protein COV19_05160 [Candidatus Woesearchaeota archaeon CG10_big_fil_rev_8_21_14_0_10_44_13]
MGDNLVTTDVDRLIGLVQLKKEISIDDAAKQLGVSSKTIESLGDMLEEEGILHIKYKFTTPYLIYEKPKTKEGMAQKEEEEMFIEEELDIKREFFSKAKARGADEAKAMALWEDYSRKYKDNLKKQFFDKAKEKGYPPRDVEKMWKQFESEI